MDKIIGLCHFCELHGPSVVLCTRCLSGGELSQLKGSSDTDTDSLMCNTRTQSFSSSYTPTSTAGTEADTRSLSAMPTNDEYGCDGCSMRCKSSANPFNGFVSYEAGRPHGYVTSGYSLGERVNQISASMIREACIRSLSCEVYDGDGREEGRERVIYFGDDHRGHILSHLFVLRDSTARGFHRTYSVIVISLNKESLLDNWQFYVHHIETIITKLRDKARVVYESELTQTTCQQRRSLILDNVTNIGAHSPIYNESVSFDDIGDRNRLNTQRNNSKARPLVELTGDETTFAAIHSQFAWILEAVDSQTHYELSSSSFQSESSHSDSGECYSSKKLSLRDYYSVLGREKFRLISYNAVIGNQLFVCHRSRAFRKLFIYGISQLLPDKCLRVKTSLDIYDESVCSKFNLIGISNRDVLPDNIFDSPYNLILTLEDKLTPNEIEKLDESNMIEIFTTSLEVRLHSGGKVVDRLPNYLTEIERILTDLTFSDTTFDLFVISLRQEWLNKVNTIYAYIQQRIHLKAEINSLLKLLNVEECDTKLIIFWSTSRLRLVTKLSQSNSESIASLFKIEPLLSPLISLNS